MEHETVIPPAIKKNELSLLIASLFVPMILIPSAQATNQNSAAYESNFNLLKINEKNTISPETVSGFQSIPYSAERLKTAHDKAIEYIRNNPSSGENINQLTSQAEKLFNDQSPPSIVFEGQVVLKPQANQTSEKEYAFIADKTLVYLNTTTGSLTINENENKSAIKVNSGSALFQKGKGHIHLSKNKNKPVVDVESQSLLSAESGWEVSENKSNSSAVSVKGLAIFGKNTTFSDNKSTASGGALHIEGGTVFLDNGTHIINNHADSSGGGAEITKKGALILNTSVDAPSRIYGNNSGSNPLTANAFHFNDGNLIVKGNGQLDILDPMSGSNASLDLQGGTTYLAGKSTLENESSVTVGENTHLYLYGEKEDSKTGASKKDILIEASAGQIDLTASNSTFTLNKGSTLTAGGKNAAVNAGTITLVEGSRLAFNVANNETANPSSPLMLNLNSVSELHTGSNLNLHISGLQGDKTGVYTLLKTNKSIPANELNVTLGGQYLKDVDFLTESAATLNKTSQDNSATLTLGTLAWNSADQKRAHGNFTVKEGDFTLGAMLNDKEILQQEPTKQWNGKDLTKRGDGNLILTAASTYSGTTHIEAGTLTTGRENAIAKTSKVVVAKGATLNLAGKDQTLTEIQGDGTILFNSENAHPVTKPISVTGNMTLSGNLVVNNCESCAGQTYTQTGNWNGKEGVVELGTVLGGDDSKTDKLIITGTATGKTYIKVKNEGGEGGQTQEGITLIETKASDDGAFVLSERVAAGGYEYDLKSKKATENKQNKNSNWYLTSYLTDKKDNASGGDIVRVRVPEAGSYATNLAAAGSLFSTQLSDRLGGSWYTDPVTGERHQTSMWLRTVASKGGGRISDGQSKYSENRMVFQLGGDVLTGSFTGEDGIHVGAMAGYGRQSSNTRNKLTDRSSKGNVDGYSGGLYGTWYQNEKSRTGLYLDSWVLYNWFTNSVQGEQRKQENYRSRGMTAALESGYTLRAASWKTTDNSEKAIYIRPQAQVLWSGIRADAHTESNGTQVRSEGRRHLQTRLGARLSMQNESLSAKASVPSFEPFVEANWLHRPDAYGVRMGEVSSYIQGNSNVAELKAGLQGQLNENFSVTGHVSQQLGGQGFKNTLGMLGIRYSF